MTYVVAENEEIYEAYIKAIGISDLCEMIPKIDVELAKGNNIVGYVPFFIASLARDVTVGLPRFNEYGEVYWVVHPETFSVKKVDESSFTLGETTAQIIIYGKEAKRIFLDLKRSRDLSIAQQKNKILKETNYITEEEAQGRHVFSESISYQVAANSVVYSQVQNKTKDKRVPYYIAGRYRVARVQGKSHAFQPAKFT